ncbi:MAG: hypothetical protein K9W42_13185 [Candidatus Heimdallarchaeota archaeon]|nr:hypothetical protein [Candidatus Heimdallarchaeota archaeon]
MYYQSPVLTLQKITSTTFLNWFLPALGIIAAVLVVIFIWRYLKHSNQAGRISEFDERAFKKIIKEESSHQLPFCSDCNLPMRLETTYKDFLHDQGEFLIYRLTLEETLTNLVKSERITTDDESKIHQFFDEHPNSTEHLFRRYKCPNCSKVVVLPYSVAKEQKKS